MRPREIPEAGPCDGFVQIGLELAPGFLGQSLAVVSDDPDLEPLAFLHPSIITMLERFENILRRTPQISDSPSADFEIKSVPSIAETVTLLGEIAVDVAGAKKARRERRAVYPHRETPVFFRNLFHRGEDQAARIFGVRTRCDCRSRS